MASLALAAVGVASIKAAADFDQAMTRVAALSNTSASAVEGMRAEVLALSGETAQAPTELADALFFLASAGLEADQVMPALEASAKGAAVGLGTTADVANIVASAMNAYSASGLTATQVTDTLTAAVREGRAEPEEFANALGRILPIASTIGVTFDQVTASLASLSNIGLDVNEGVTAMRGVFQALAAPTKQAGEALASVGVDSQELLNIISEEGIIGALRFLDKSVRANTQGTAAYNDVMRKIVPNVRALTAVFGLTIQQSSKVNQIFDAVKNSTGSLGDAFRTTAESDAFQLQKAFNDARIALLKFGSNALPQLVSALQKLGPVIEVVAKNLDLLILTFAAFKVGSMASAAGATAFGGALGPIAGIIGGAIMAGRELNDTFFGMDHDVKELAATLSGQLQPALEAGIISTDLYLEASKAVRDPTMGNAEALLRVAAALQAEQIAQEKEAASKASAKLAADSYVQSLQAQAAGIDQSGHAIERVADSIRSFAGMSGPALKEFNQNLGQSAQVAAGQFQNLKEAFDTTPAELKKQLDLAIQIARRFAADIKEILTDKSLSEGQKAALLELPANQRAAFADATKAGKEELARGATELSRLNAAAMRGVGNAAKAPAQAGGTATGHAIMTGVATGIREGAGAAAAAGVTAVNEIVARMNRAAGIASPSKKTRELAHELMEGLKAGIEDKDREVAQKLVDSIRKMLDAAKSALGDFRSKMQDFAGGISGGFSSFSDFVGGFGEGEHPLGIQDFLANQLGEAQQFADVLDALNRQGASKGLLSQIAGAGPEGLGFAQALLQGGPALVEQASKQLEAINKIADHEGGVLSKDFFGNKMDKLQAKADRIAELLAEANRLQSGKGGDITLMLDGKVLAKVTRDQLLKLGDRNAGTGL